MKIGTPELKTKPATKYFEGGYISFKTQDKELFYKVVRVTKTRQGTLISGKVENEEELKALLAVKTLTDITGVLS